MVTEHDEQLGYDADHDDPSQFCRHGTFIGSWWGPDYLCHWCESGEEPTTREEEIAYLHRILDCAETRWAASIASIANAMNSPEMTLDRRAGLRHAIIETAYRYDLRALLAYEILRNEGELV